MPEILIFDSAHYCGQLDLDVAIPLELIVEGVPVSQQTRNRKNRLKKWRQDVCSAARRLWDEEPSTTGALMVTITYVYDEVRLDVDNIPKPILDALKGLVFSDDDQITDMLCRKRYLNADLQIHRFSPVLNDALAKSTPFVHIIVDHAPDQEVIF